MKNIFGIFRADFRRISNSVVASVVIIGLCLVPCLYAWFNILSNSGSLRRGVHLEHKGRGGK